MGGFLSHADEACFELAEYSRGTISRLNGALPPLLYHYTSENGVIGILESGTLRLGNLEWMDDKTEVTHAASAFRTQLDRLYLVEGTDPRGKELLAAMRRELNRPLRVSNVYSMSFSEDGNSEPLWNLYSEMGAGFTVALGREEFLLAKDRPAWADVWRVIYDADDLAGYCADALQVILDTYLSRFHPDHYAHAEWFPPVDEMALAYLKEISHFAPAFKARDWSYQREWRWTAIHPFEPDSSERYFTLPLRTTSDDILLPICSINAGPRCSKDSIANVRETLARFGYHKAIFRQF